MVDRTSHNRSYDNSNRATGALPEKLTMFCRFQDGQRGHNALIFEGISRFCEKELLSRIFGFGALRHLRLVMRRDLGQFPAVERSPVVLSSVNGFQVT